MISYTFDYRKEKTREGEVIYRPAIYVYLQSTEKVWYLFDAYLDSGADLSLFTRSDCEFLGHNLNRGKKRFIGGVSGGLIRVFVHKVPLRIGEIVINAEIGFAEIEEVPRLIGRKTVFHHFKICFDEDELKIFLYLKRNNKFPSQETCRS